jgi:predicted NAD/FAD-binding protein
MKIAIIGTGIAGNVVAHRLHRAHEISLFEAGGHVGGHTHTHDIEFGGRHYAVDTGFIVFNDWTYPNFVELLWDLGVESQPSHMSFSVMCERSGLEYNGTSFNTLFAQRRNLLRPSFWRMLRDIMRFNREAPAVLQNPREASSLGDFLAAQCYSREFIEHYLAPMGAAIWSADPDRLLAFPASFFIRFFHNHGMLSVNQRPQWRVIQGGSARYVERLTAPFRDRIRLHCPVEWIRRHPSHVTIKACGAEPERFDVAFLACHSDQALALLADANSPEREVLGAIPFQANQAVLHTDTRLLPRHRRAWAAWNYHIPREPRARVALTYNMNILQSLDAPTPLLVTLNHGEAVDPDKILRKMTYHHPVFTPAAIAAQRRHAEIDGARRTFFCGAYWRNGFHEDGVVSAHTALQHFYEHHVYAQLPLRRTG